MKCIFIALLEVWSFTFSWEIIFFINFILLSMYEYEHVWESAENLTPNICNSLLQDARAENDDTESHGFFIWEDGLQL